MTRETSRYIELAAGARTIRVGFAPPDPEGTPSNLLTIRDGADKLLGAFSPADVKDAAFALIGMKPDAPVPARNARLLACFALAFINLRPELLPHGASPSGAGSEAGAASPGAAPAPSCSAAPPACGCQP